MLFSNLCQLCHLCVLWENSIAHDDSNLVLLVIALPVQIHETHSILRGKRTTRPILNCILVNKTPDLSAIARIVVGTYGLQLGRSDRLCNTGEVGGKGEEIHVRILDKAVLIKFRNG